MQQTARTARGIRHWTGRILPVLCVAVLAIGAVHAKDKKKSTAETVAGQLESRDSEATRRFDVPSKSEPPKREEPTRREEPPKREDPPRREDAPKSEPKLMSEARVKEQAEKRHDAKVVRQDRGESDGRPVYRLRLLSDRGVVSNIVVDAETGKELK
jgi:uncharacterized membrane protein YkoI